MNMEALIFDVDGTLADTEELHRQAFNQAFEQLQLDWRWSPAEYRALLKITGGKERITADLQQRPFSAAQQRSLLARVPEIHAEKTRLYTAMVQAGGLTLRPGVARLLDEARQAGLRLAIASTTTAANIDALLHATLGADGLDLFDVIACGDQVRHKKPAPDIYELALDTLGVPADRAVALEDSSNGLRAAVAAGLWTLVTPTYWSEGDDFSAAGLVLPHLGDADHPLPRQAPDHGPWLSLTDLLSLATPQRPINAVHALYMPPPRSLAVAAPQGGSRSGPAEPDPRTPLERSVPRSVAEDH